MWRVAWYSPGSVKVWLNRGVVAVVSTVPASVLVMVHAQVSGGPPVTSAANPTCWPAVGFVGSTVMVRTASC